MSTEDLGFIILRHINDSTSSCYWKECVKCIRKFYDVNVKIIIIDDNSSLASDDKTDFDNVDNVDIKYSELKGSGEIYGYYYAWKYRPFKKFFVLHDSMFLQDKLDDQVDTVRFLWHFDTYLGGTNNGSYSRSELEERDLNAFFITFCKEDQRQQIFDLYYDKNNWYGCFGVASLIDLSFLDKVFDTFDFENVIKNVKCRPHREAMERIFALLCILLDKTIVQTPSMFGNILKDYQNAYSNKWSNYINGYRTNCLINKVWSGR
jgi:hypothetical protein